MEAIFRPVPGDALRAQEIRDAFENLRESENMSLLALHRLLPANSTSIVWKRSEDKIRLTGRAPFRGCDTDKEMLENLSGCMRSALSFQGYDHAIWLLYLAERERIPFFNERFWRDLDDMLTVIPLSGTIPKRFFNIELFLRFLLTSKVQYPLVAQYVQRLVEEEKWELLVRIPRVVHEVHRYAQLLFDIVLPDRLFDVFEYACCGTLASLSFVVPRTERQAIELVRIKAFHNIK